jgi:hypothetical protein
LGVNSPVARTCGQCAPARHSTRRPSRGYTIEAFFKLPKDFSGANAWSALLSRLGTGRDAGKTATTRIIDRPLAVCQFVVRL